MKVFLFTEGLSIDYLSNLVVSELLSNPEIELYITEMPKFLFVDYQEDVSGMYGMGYTIAKKVQLKYKNAIEVHEDYIEDLLSQKTMDLIVYSSVRRKFRPPHRRLEWKHPKQPCDFFHIVTKYYPKEKIIAFEGEDDNYFLDVVIDKVSYYKRELLPKDINKAESVSFSFPSYWEMSPEYFESEKVHILAEYSPKNPGKRFEDEREYYKQYSKALFGYTMKKAGWDCMRHYEILAAGALPYFENIEEKPETIMKSWPTRLQVDINNLYEKIQNESNLIDSISDKDLTYWEKLHSEFNDWFKEHGKTSIYSKILWRHL